MRLDQLTRTDGTVNKLKTCIPVSRDVWLKSHKCRAHCTLQYFSSKRVVWQKLCLSSASAPPCNGIFGARASPLQMRDDLQPQSGGRARVRRPAKRPMGALDAWNFCTETHNQLVSFQNIFSALHFSEVTVFKIKFTTHIIGTWVASNVQTCFDKSEGSFWFLQPLIFSTLQIMRY